MSFGFSIFKFFVLIPKSPESAYIPFGPDLPGFIKRGKIKDLNIILLGPLLGVDKVFYSIIEGLSTPKIDSRNAVTNVNV